jgi:hypothetical protein
MLTRFLLLCLASAALGAAESPVWRPFSADSLWNQRIAATTPSDRNSDVLIADLASRGPWHVNIAIWSIPVYFIDADHTPRHDVGDLRPGIYGAGFEFPRSIPIPDSAVASPPVGEDSDNHLCIIDRTKHLEWGMWAARQDKTGRWFTGLGAVTDLSGTGVAPPWFAVRRQLDSARGRASGFPLIAGLILRDEIKASRIDHALVFAYDHCRTGHFIPPASTAQVAQLDAVDTRGIPMGGRIQLDPAWDVEHSGLSPTGKIIAHALQDYGAYCGDYAGANVLYAENSPEAVQGWTGILLSNELAAVFNPEMIRQHFRVVDMGNLLPGQNLAVPPPYVIAFAVAGETARIDQLSRTITLERNRTAGTRTKASWTLFPQDTRAQIGTQTLVSGLTEINFTGTTTLNLTAPDGAQSTWQIVTVLR